MGQSEVLLEEAVWQLSSQLLGWPIQGVTCMFKASQSYLVISVSAETKITKKKNKQTEKTKQQKTWEQEEDAGERGAARGKLTDSKTALPVLPYDLQGGSLLCPVPGWIFCSTSSS